MRKNRIEEGKKTRWQGRTNRRVGEKTQKQKKTPESKGRNQRRPLQEKPRKKKKRTRTRKRGEGIPLFAFYCHPPSTFKSHHIGFHPVLEESPWSPLPPQSSRDFFSAP
jgi:hypothetical protein